MKKTKRTFSLFLTLALVLSLLPALSPAARADGITTVNVSTYTELSTAMARAYDSEVEIKLANDIIQKDSDSGHFIGNNSTNSFKITLDLNGHTLARETSGKDIMLLTLKPAKGEIVVTDTSTARTGMLYFKNTNSSVNTTMVVSINGTGSFFEVVLNVPGCYNASTAASNNYCIYGDQAAGRIKGGCYYGRNKAVYLNYGRTTNSFNIEGGSFYSSLDCTFFTANNTAQGNVYVYKGYFGRVSPNQSVSSNTLFYIGSDLAFSYFISNSNNVTVNGSTRDISKMSRAVNGLTDIGAGEFIVSGETRVLLDMPANTPTANTQTPVITQQPQSASAAVGGTLTFSVTASNVTIYDWYVCDADDGRPYDWADVKAHAAVSGATTAAMTLKPTDTWLNGKAVYCDIKGTDGNWYSSSSADITVTDSAVPKPTITTQPVGKTGVKTGTAVTLSVAAAGTGTLSYQWYQAAANDISTIIADTTAFSDTYTVPQTPGTVYYCVGVTNTVGGKTSDMVYSNLVGVSYEAGKVPAISTQPQPVSKPEGGAATFTVTAAGDDLHYKWYRESGGTAAEVGTDSPTLTVSPLNKTEHDGGSYYCVVTNSYGSVTSAKSTLTVYAASATPAVDYSPASVTLKKGGTATVTASAVVAESAKGTLSYQWYAGSSSVPSMATVLSGETAASVTVGSGMSEGESRWYFCVVTNTKDGVKTSSFSDSMAGVKVTVQAETATSFTDVTAGAYYASAVSWAVDSAVTSGTGANTFSPDAACDRAQTVTFLWRAMGKAEPSGTANPFTDVASAAYYYKPVLWAAEKGVTNGSSATTFSPDATVTRAAFVTFLWRAAGKPAVSAASSFTDVTDATAYYYNAVAWAVSKGITTGTSASTFSPDAPCSRAQVVTFLFRYFK